MTWTSEDLMYEAWTADLQSINARLDQAKRRAILPARPIPDCRDYQTAWREGFIQDSRISHAKRAVNVAARLMVPSIMAARNRMFQETVALFG